MARSTRLRIHADDARSLIFDTVTNPMLRRATGCYNSILRAIEYAKSVEPALLPPLRHILVRKGEEHAHAERPTERACGRLWLAFADYVEAVIEEEKRHH